MGVCEALCDMLAGKKGYTNTFDLIYKTESQVKGLTLTSKLNTQQEKETGEGNQAEKHKGRENHNLH